MTLDYSQMKIALRMLQNMIKDGAQNLRSSTQNSVGSILPMTLRRGRRYCVSCFLLKPWWKLCWWKVLFPFLWQEQVSLSLSFSHTHIHTHTFNYKYHLPVFDNRLEAFACCQHRFQTLPRGCPLLSKAWGMKND